MNRSIAITLIAVTLLVLPNGVNAQQPMDSQQGANAQQPMNAQQGTPVTTSQNPVAGSAKAAHTTAAKAASNQISTGPQCPLAPPQKGQDLLPLFTQIKQLTADCSHTQLPGLSQQVVQCARQQFQQQIQGASMVTEEPGYTPPPAANLQCAGWDESALASKMLSNLSDIASDANNCEVSKKRQIGDLFASFIVNAVMIPALGSGERSELYSGISDLIMKMTHLFSERHNYAKEIAEDSSFDSLACVFWATQNIILDCSELTPPSSQLANDENAVLQQLTLNAGGADYDGPTPNLRDQIVQMKEDQATRNYQEAECKIGESAGQSSNLKGAFNQACSDLKKYFDSSGKTQNGALAQVLTSLSTFSKKMKATYHDLTTYDGEPLTEFWMYSQISSLEKFYPNSISDKNGVIQLYPPNDNDGKFVEAKSFDQISEMNYFWQHVKTPQKSAELNASHEIPELKLAYMEVANKISPSFISCPSQLQDQDYQKLYKYISSASQDELQSHIYPCLKQCLVLEGAFEEHFSPGPNNTVQFSTSENDNFNRVCGPILKAYNCQQPRFSQTIGWNNNFQNYREYACQNNNPPQQTLDRLLSSAKSGCVATNLYPGSSKQNTKSSK